MLINQVISDLIAHETETGLQLPIDKHNIAILEIGGYIVDLGNGAIFEDPDQRQQKKNDNLNVQKT